MKSFFRLLIPNKAASSTSMDAEIRLVSRFHALMLSRYIVSLALFAFMLYTSIFGFQSASPLYIIGVLNLLPVGLEHFLAPYVPKKTVVLPYLRKHYRYNSLRFATNSITSTLTCFLLLLWQLHLNIDRLSVAWLKITPLLLLALIVLFRLLVPLFLAKYISQKLLAGKY